MIGVHLSPAMASLRFFGADSLRAMAAEHLESRMMKELRYFHYYLLGSVPEELCANLTYQLM